MARSGKTLHVVSWNVENLAPYLTDGAATRIPDLLDRMGRPDVMCLQEVRIRPHDEPLVASMSKALRGYRCDWSLNRDARNASFRGGRAYGVATWSRKSLQGEGRSFDWDLEGRATVTLLPLLGWAIVNVYAVNGTSKAYWDHDQQRYAGDRHLFKRRFIERLGDEAQALRSEGFELILIGDWNISRERIDTWPRLRTEEPHATARAAFNDRFLPRLELVDVFRTLHPDARQYTWFNRRARGGGLDAARVDYALVSASLLPLVLDAGIENIAAMRAGSDHAPLWLRLRRS